ncbi:MAG: hypothetical protein JSV03_12610 [Planctomycetota bacterium]|nr:MAG: hypothetical protein JSV03_12610 [Planctomycetota bacterium]
MDLPTAAADKLILDSGGYIDQDVACIRCGYNLRGLLPERVCPECGTPIGRSTYGDLLQFCDPLWVRTLASGTNWMVGGILCAFLGAFLSGAVSAVASSNIKVAIAQVLAFEIACGLVMLIGGWKVTTPDPSKVVQEQKLTARKLTRIIYVTTFVLGPVQQLIESYSHPASVILAVINGILGIVGTVTVFIYARQLALRIPDEGLAKQTRIVMWGLIIASIFTTLSFAFMLVLIRPAMTAGTGPGTAPIGAGLAVWPIFGIFSCFGGTASLVFGIWSIILLLRYRRFFNQAARDAEATWAGVSTPTGALAPPG